MVGLLVLGFLIVRVADKGGRNVSQDEALTIARQRVDFQPTGHQIRYVRRGIPSHGYWVASFYIQKKTGLGYSRITVVVVDATSGRVTEVRRTE